MRRLYKLIGRKFGKKFLKKVKEKLGYAGIRVKADEWIGFNIVFSILLSLAITLIISIPFRSILLIPIFIGICFASLITSYSLVLLLIRMRQVSVENVLPDYLSLVASYINAGISLERSLLISCKPEFGVLNEEMKGIASTIVGGKRIEDVLPKLKEKFESPRLWGVVDLILEGIRSGANMADLLQRISFDIREEQMVKREIIAMIMAYASFIFLASCIASPLLYGISSFLFELITHLTGIIGTTRYRFFQITPIPSHLVDIIFYANMVITSILGSLFVGIIRKGDEREGLKYIPIMILMSFLIFFSTKILLIKLFGKIFI